jgi:threonine dehydratase
MPATTPFVKVHRTEVLGARILLIGDGLADAADAAARIVEDEGRVLVHPYDDAAVIAGQGTVALEMLEDHPDLETIVVPTGGGGLVAGMAVVTRALRPDLRMVGAQSARWPSMVAATTGEDLECSGSTLADGIAVPTAGALTQRLVTDLVDDVVTVTDESVEAAVNLLLEIEKVVVEGAGAAGVAALLEHPELRPTPRDGDRGGVGVVLSGGNIDPRLLASVVLRGLVRSGRLARLLVEVRDAPGSLGAVTTILGQAGANIVELSHERMFLDVPARSAELEVVVETFDHEHLERVVAALAAAGFTAQIGEVHR